MTVSYAPSREASSPAAGREVTARAPRVWLRRYTKLLCFLVLGLILKGALVTSHDAGLSVPDWPTSYNQNMFLFPPSRWQGIIFYEHVHRLYASAIGFLTVVLAVWVGIVEERRWVRVLSYGAVAAVIAQGILGGLTVLLLLPTSVSAGHAVLAQTFFILTLIIAYSQSNELRTRAAGAGEATARPLVRWGLLLSALVYVQLIIGAVMRHSDAGLAVPDFPTMGGSWLPSLSAEHMDRINALRASIGRAPASIDQVAVHLAHRGGALVILVTALGLLFAASKLKRSGSLSPLASRAVTAIGLIVAVQVTLGIFTVLTLRSPWVASFHVVVGAALLGMSVLTVLRSIDVRKLG